MGQLLAEHRLHRDDPARRREIERRMETDDEEGLKALRRGGCLGGQDFKERRREENEGPRGEPHFGALRREAAETKARRVIGEERARRRKSEPANRGIAARRRRATMWTIRRIAGWQFLGTSRSAIALLHATMRRLAPVASDQTLLAI